MSARTTPATQGWALTGVHTTFQKWFGQDYDLDAINATLAAAAVEKIDGDPLWLLVIGGPGIAKTETVQSLSHAGAHIISTLTGESALLSATPQRECSSEATGGLLRVLGSRGILVLKDATSILAMNRDTRASVLAAFRDVYDGLWIRNVGAEGARALTWRGRIVVIGAVTTAWDRAHEVIASLGDRFVLLRLTSTNEGRRTAGIRAVSNTGDEPAMREELATAVAVALATVDPHTAGPLVPIDRDRIVSAANLVTLARTAVDYDYRGDVIDAHAPEMPTRFAKQLAQIVRGALLIGMTRRAALTLAIRCARDSMPPLRLAILDDLARHSTALTSEVRKRLEKPRATIDRQLQALHILGVIQCDEEDIVHAGQSATLRRYRLSVGIDPTALDPSTVPDFSPPSPAPVSATQEKRRNQ